MSDDEMVTLTEYANRIAAAKKRKALDDYRARLDARSSTPPADPLTKPPPEPAPSHRPDHERPPMNHKNEEGKFTFRDPNPYLRALLKQRGQKDHFVKPKPEPRPDVADALRRLSQRTARNNADAIRVILGESINRKDKP